MHYIEYLSKLIRKHKLDTLRILSSDDLEALLRRAGIPLPPRPLGPLDFAYRDKLRKVLILFRVLLFLCVFLSAPPRLQYIEYIVGLITRHKIDPISIFDLTDVQQELRRRGMALPTKGANTTDDEYRTLCVKLCQFHNSWNSQHIFVQYRCAKFALDNGISSKT